MAVEKLTRGSWRRVAVATRTPTSCSATLLAVLAVLVLSVGVAAQYGPDDLIIASGSLSGAGGIVSVAPNGQVTPFPTVVGFVYSMMTAPDNRSIWVTAMGGPPNPSGVFEFAPDGTVRSILLGSTPILLGVDEGGGAVCFEFSRGIMRLGRNGAIMSICAQPSFHYTAAGIDLTTGDLIVDLGTEIHRVNLHGTAVQTTVASQVLTYLQGTIAHDPVTDLMLGASGSSLRVLRVNGPFAAATIAYPQQQKYSAIGSIVIDPGLRAALLPLRALQSPWNPVARISLLDLATFTVVGTALAATPSHPFDPAHVAVAHSRHLCGLSPAQRGGVYSALVSYPAEPGAAYVVGFSFGLRPGIWLPDGRVICLRSDPLLALSLTNSGIFSGCRGTLDPNGEAVAHMAVPRINSLQGLRVFAAAVTLANGNIQTISAPIGVTIQ